MKIDVSIGLVGEEGAKTEGPQEAVERWRGAVGRVGREVEEPAEVG